MTVDADELAIRFTYHAPHRGQQERYEEIRDHAARFADYIVSHTPESREQALALTNLEQAVMWANAAIVAP